MRVGALLEAVKPFGFGFVADAYAAQLVVRQARDIDIEGDVERQPLLEDEKPMASISSAVASMTAPMVPL